MNAILNIQIRVAANQARREIASVGTAIKQAQAVANSGKAGGLTGMANQFGLAGTAAAGFAGKLDRVASKAATAFKQFPVWNKRMESMGKNMQWVGRQLEFNFTLPLVTAGYFATKWALANEKATIQVKKVYGDLSFTQERINEETKALSTSFELLSTRFGVNQAEVIEMAAAWAAAGSAGRGLAENTRATLEAMIIGDMDAATATEALISIMSTYRISSKKAADGTSELGTMLADLNIIENQTGIQFKGLIDVMQRAGGSAAQAGVDVRHLSAMAAALVPSAATAAQAGNSLRTMISRLQAPTRDTIDVLQKMGISVMSKEWLGKTATEKIEYMAESFNDLSSANQTLVSSVVASRWQVNRFARLMQDIGSGTGYYQKALDATSDTAKENGDITRQQAVYWRELGTVLDSNPKKFDILANSIKNNLTSAVIPLIPAIMGVVATIANLAQAFADLDPETQKFIVFGLAFLAITGPIVRLMGAWILLISQLGKTAFFAGKAMFWMGKQAIQAIFWIITSLGKLLTAQATTVYAHTFGELKKVKATNAATGAIVASYGARTTAAIGGSTAQAAAGAAGATAAAAAWMAAFTEEGLAYMVWLDSFALGQGTAAAASVTAAEISATAWTTSAAISAGAQTAAMGEIAAAQAIPALGAGAAATRTVGIFGRMFAGIAAIASRFGIIVMTALEGAIAAIAGALGLPFWAVVAIIAAAVAAIVLILTTDLEEPVWRIVESIGRGLMQLPRIFGQVLSTVARVVAGWIRVIWDLLSYLNPFATHSPSLVDNVKAGVATILNHYASLKKIGPTLMAAVRAHENFNKAIASTQAGFDASERGEQRKDIAKVAPQAVPAFDVLGRQVSLLKASLAPLAAEITKQARVTAIWQAKVDALNASLALETRRLDRINDKLAGVTAAMDAARDVIAKMGSMNLPGMRAAEDQIFANEQAQKRLRLEILRMGDAGETIDELKDRMAALAGLIELLGGEREELRLAGAGSDVLRTYDQEIAALEAQYDAIQSQGSAVSDLEKQLEELQRQGEMMELEKSLRFDGPLRQIDQMIEGLNEMPFDKIVAEIRKQQEVLRELQPEFDRLTEKARVQEAVVEAITTKHDAANLELQKQNDILSELESAYDDIEAQIREMESAMDDFAASAKAAIDAAKAAKQSTAEQLFDAGVGADFEVPIGADLLGAEGTLADIEAFNEELQAELEKIMDEMGGFEFKMPDMPDPFGTVRQWFDNFVAFIREWGWIILGLFLVPFTGGISLVVAIIERWGPEIWGALKGAWDFAWDLFEPYVEGALGGLREVWNRGWAAIGTGISFVWDSVLMPIFDAMVWVFDNVLAPAFRTVADAAVWAWQTVIYPVIQEAWDLIKPILEALWGFFIDYILPVFQLLAAVVEIVFVVIARVIEWVWNEILYPFFTNTDDFISNTVIPAFQNLWSVVEIVFRAVAAVVLWAWQEVIYPAFSAIWGFITDKLVPIFNFLWTVVKTVFGAIGFAIMWAWQNVISPAFNAVWGFVRDTLGPAFTWLWEEVIDPAMDGIGSAISFAWNDIIKPIFERIDWVIHHLIGPAFEWLRDKVIKPVWDTISEIISNVWDTIVGVIETGINAVITVFNILAEGVRRVASALSIDVTINKMDPVSLREGGVVPPWSKGGGIPAMAAGGYVPQAPTMGGFHGTNARAIVAEGSKAHREFVIPTDPNYRERAKSLYAMLGKDLGVTPAPGMAEGGVVGGIPGLPPGMEIGQEIFGLFGDAAGAVGGAASKAAEVAKKFWDMITDATRTLGSMSGGFIKSVATWMKDKVVDWGRGKLSELAEKAVDILPGGDGISDRNVIKIAAAQMAKDKYGWTGANWTALDKLITGESGWNPNAQNPTSTAYGLFQFLNSTWAGVGGSKTSDVGKQLEYGFRYIAQRYGNPSNAYATWLSRSPHWYEMGGILNMANGGAIVPHQSGGVLMRVGEGRNDEKVQVLPLTGRNGDNGTVNNFYGDLVFPHITDPTDAEEFIKNLETLGAP